MNQIINEATMTSDQAAAKPALVSAAERGDLDIVVSCLVDPHCDVNARDDDGYTALTRAAANGHVDCVTACLQHASCDVNAATHRGDTALTCAVWANQLQCVQACLQHPRCDVNAANSAQHFALVLAIRKIEDGTDPRGCMLKELLQCASCDVNQRSSWSQPGPGL